MFYKAIVKGKRPLWAASEHVIQSTTSAAANTSSAIFSRVFGERRSLYLAQSVLVSRDALSGGAFRRLQEIPF